MWDDNTDSRWVQIIGSLGSLFVSNHDYRCWPVNGTFHVSVWFDGSCDTCFIIKVVQNDNVTKVLHYLWYILLCTPTLWTRNRQITQKLELGNKWIAVHIHVCVCVCVCVTKYTRRVNISTTVFGMNFHFVIYGFLRNFLSEVNIATLIISSK